MFDFYFGKRRKEEKRKRGENPLSFLICLFIDFAYSHINVVKPLRGFTAQQIIEVSVLSIFEPLYYFFDLEDFAFFFCKGYHFFSRSFDCCEHFNVVHVPICTLRYHIHLCHVFSLFLRLLVEYRLSLFLCIVYHRPGVLSMLFANFFFVMLHKLCSLVSGVFVHSAKCVACV